MFANKANSSCAMDCFTRSARMISPKTKAVTGSKEGARRGGGCRLTEESGRWGTAEGCQSCYVPDHGIYASLKNQYIAPFMPKNPRPKTQAKPKTEVTKQPSALISFLAQLRFQPPAAALPCNLSDELLGLVARDLDAMLNEVQPQDTGSRPDAVSLGLVLHILAGQPGDGQPGILLADIFAAMEDYRLEITMELKKRRTGIHSIPATMETIFKRRGTNDDPHH